LYSSYGIGNATSTTSANLQVQYPVQMRVTPTSVDYSTLGISVIGVSTNAVTSLTFGSNANNSLRAVLTTGVASGLTSGNFYSLTSNNSTTAYLGFSAEL
jgi:hypothetical protein